RLRDDPRIRSATVCSAVRPSRFVRDRHVRMEGSADRGADGPDRRGKTVIYDGFKAAVAAGVPKHKAGILVDEQFGAARFSHAKAKGSTTACPAEKSGQDEFGFEYGEDFSSHIEAFQPTFSKVLVRYNLEGNQALNQRQAERLRQLSRLSA